MIYFYARLKNTFRLSFITVEYMPPMPHHIKNQLNRLKVRGHVFEMMVSELVCFFMENKWENCVLGKF